MLVELLRALGRNLDESFRAAHYAVDALPALASAALGEARLHERLGLMEVARWLADIRDLPADVDRSPARAGQTLVAYGGTRIVVELVVAMAPRFTIHQHESAGAFQVLRGRSVHTTYAFALEESRSDDLRVGRLVPRSAELLSAGDVRAVSAGSDFIHARSELEPPGLCLVVRSRSAPAHQPAWLYDAPGVARQLDRVDPLTTRRIELLRAVDALLDARAAQARIDEVVEDTTAAGAFSVLANLQDRALAPTAEGAPRPIGWREALDRPLSRARVVHGDIVSSFESALWERARIIGLARRRGAVERDEERVALTLLAAVPVRAEALRLLRDCFPDRDPEALLVGVEAAPTPAAVGGDSP